jgi:hypothetical protein
MDLCKVQLESFFDEASRGENKELIDIGRVNLGMIKGTLAMKNFSENMKTKSYDEFLKMSLKYFSENSEK